MQSAAFTISLSLPLLKSPRQANPTFSHGFSHMRFSCASSHRNDLKNSVNVSASSFWPAQSWSLSSSSFSSSKIRPWDGRQLLASDSGKNAFEVRATSVPQTTAGDARAGGLMKTIELGMLMGLWYILNIYFNIYNKQVLNVYPFPVTITAVQFAVGTLLVIFIWGFNLYKKPKISGVQLAAILPLAAVHTLGHLFSNMSLPKVSLSFTHTIKAMEPLFSVVLSAMFLGEVQTSWVVISLLPIISGVALASVTVTSFNWSGFSSAMASNLTNQTRNVLSKKLMVKKEESLDNITLFSIITIMSFFLIVPVALFMEGVKFTPAYLQYAGLNFRQVFIGSLFAALCFHACQQVSYVILQRVSPVTHSVGSCVKRVVAIVSAVIFFQTPVSPINSYGTVMALAGVFLYSRVKHIKPKSKNSY